MGRLAIIFGPPGSGKGTQSRLVSDSLDFCHLSTGDMLREASNIGSDLGLKARELMDSGNLVPDDMVNGIVAAHIHGLDGKKDVLLDGYPRTMEQAYALDRSLMGTQYNVNVVLSLTVRDSVLKERILNRKVCTSCGSIFGVPVSVLEPCGNCGGKLVVRGDDNLEALSDRLQVYRERTLPILNFYSDRGLVVVIDAERPVPEIFSSISKELSKFY